VVALWRFLRRDLSAFGDCLRKVAPPRPGLYTYRFTPPGGRGRIHLRIEADGRGVLWVDVTDVVHLNATAAEMALWALDGVPLAQAQARLAARHGGTTARRAAGDLRGVYELVRRGTHRGTAGGCPTCGLETVARAELFTVPVSAPFKADLALTYQCNNDCPHCYNEAERLRMKSLPPDQWKRVIDRLCHVGVPHLIFTGGEATLYPELAELIAHADAQGPVCGLNSNGRRFAHAGYARALAAAGLNHVQITLGSHRPEVHDRMMHAASHGQTVRGIQQALEAGLHTITNTTLMRMNADEIEETIGFIHRVGVRTLAVNGMIYSGGGGDTDQAIPESQLAPTLVRIRDRARELGMRLLWYTPTPYCEMSPVELEVGAKRCNAGEYSLCVEPNGDVLPCQSYYQAAGNLLRDPWEQIWNSGLFRSFRERQADPRFGRLPEMCWECPDLPLCGGGCRIVREVQEARDAAPGGGCGGAGGCGSCHADPSAGSPGHPPLGFVALEALAGPPRQRASGRFG